MGKLFKAGLIVGAAYMARKYFRSDFDRFVGKAKDTLGDIGADIKSKDKTVTESFKDSVRKVG